MTMTCTRMGWVAAFLAQAAAPETSSDEMLIRRIAQGDQLAMRTLFGRHRVPLYRWLLRLVGAEALAEDLWSDVFLDVWRQAASFEARASVSTWLLAIARYKALSARRRQTDAELDDHIASTVAGPADGPDLVLEKKSATELMQACLAELSPEHREVMDLVYYHDKSVREVASIIGIPEPTVKTRMFYARKKLAELVTSRSAGEVGALIACPSLWKVVPHARAGDLCLTRGGLGPHSLGGGSRPPHSANEHQKSGLIADDGDVPRQGEVSSNRNT